MEESHLRFYSAARDGEHIIQHFLRQAAGKRVLLAGMVAADQEPLASERRGGSVSELRDRPLPPTATPCLVDDRAPADLSECHKDAYGEQVDGLGQPGAAVFDFIDRRLIAWGGAMPGGGDRAVYQL